MGISASQQPVRQAPAIGQQLLQQHPEQLWPGWCGRRKVQRALILLLCLFAFARDADSSVEPASLAAAITASRDSLLAQPTGESGRLTMVETNSLYTSMQILLYYYVGRQEPNAENIQALRQYLLNTQAVDGSWLFLEGGPSVASLTVLNYFALKLSGFGADDPALLRSREFIRSHGGAEAVSGDMYGLLLALFGQFELPSAPAMPPALLITIAPELSWVRMLVIPLMVVLQQQAVCQPPVGFSIDELFLNKAGSRAMPPDMEVLQIMRAACAQAAQSSGAWVQADVRPGYGMFARWLLARQNASDGLFYDSLPATFCALLSLKAIQQYRDCSAAIDRALAGLRLMQAPAAGGMYQSPSDATVPVTCSVALALLSSGLTLEAPGVAERIDFLWEHQHTKYGDWFFQVAFPVLPGGWGFTYNSESFPDSDDTAGVLLTLQTAYDGKEGERLCIEKGTAPFIG